VWEPYGPSRARWALVALAVATGLSVALYRWFEHPAEQRLRARFRRRLGLELSSGNQGFIPSPNDESTPENRQAGKERSRDRGF